MASSVAYAVMPCVSSARDGVLDDLGETDDPTRQRGLGRAGERALDARRQVDRPASDRLAQDRRDARVRVLDVVDGVLAGLLLCQLDVEVDAGRRGA